VDSDAREAIARRIDEQGWDQGCFVDLKHWAFIGNATAPTSSLGAQIVEAEDLHEGAFVAHAEPEEQLGVVVTSQLCDVVADPDVEPFCDAMPLVRVPEDEPLPHPNSTRAFLIDAAERIAADGTYRIYFEKSLLPDEPATQLLDDERRRLFAAWLARRSSRVPFPNDLVATVGRAIDWAWRKKRFAKSEVARATYLWRVGIYGDDEDHVDFLIPYDERKVSQDNVDAFVVDFFAEVRERLPAETDKARDYETARGTGAEIRSYTIGAAVARSAKQVSMRQMLDMPPLNLEHLTYVSDAIAGAESHVEREG
jgi:hypothetical protein